MTPEIINQNVLTHKIRLMIQEELNKQISCPIKITCKGENDKKNNLIGDFDNSTNSLRSIELKGGVKKLDVRKR